jgi:hypothetical protein
VAQVVELLPGKCEALSSNPSMAKKIKKDSMKKRNKEKKRDICYSGGGCSWIKGKSLRRIWVNP